MNPGETIIVADFEAGLGTLTRLGDTRVDVAVVVVEPMVKSLEVGSRVAAHAAEHSAERVIVVANRVRNDADLDMVQRWFPDQKIVVVPDDPSVREADRRGVAPLDAAPSSPAMAALGELASLVGA